MNRRVWTAGIAAAVLHGSITLCSAARAADAEDKVQQIDAWIYWYNLELDRLLEVQLKGDQVIGKIQKRHGQFPFSIAQSAINSPTEKENALKEVVGELIGWLQSGTDFEAFAIQRLTKLTGEQFVTPREWIDWYKRTSGRLKLSSNSGRLVVN